MSPKVVILVPRRNDEGWRDRLWGFCRSVWEREFPDYPIFEGHHLPSEGPFNRSLAINRAALLADEATGGWDIALTIDSDTISEPEAVRRAVQHSWETGDLAIAHNARHMLSRKATEAVLSGTPVTSLKGRMAIRKTYYDSVSCAVVVRRSEWDAVHGFDNRFVGWGFEDTAFRIAVETFTNRVMHVEQAGCYHLWHESAPGASHVSPTFAKNHALKIRYENAHYQPERLHAILHGEPDPGLTYGAIPRVIHRTVPAETPEQVEAWWAHFHTLHPTWELRTWRDPLSPEDFPLTGHLHERCANGAQKAGLVRLELLVTHGGVYVDSDVEAVRPLDALTHVPAFAGWEDAKVVPDAVLGATPGHPAFREMLSKAIHLIENGSQDAWETGPGITTAVLPNRDDVLLLPPGSFYPVHYKEKTAIGTRNNLPWVFLEHKWHHSWAKKPAKQSVKKTSSRQSARKSTVDVTPKIKPPEGITRYICMPYRDSGDHWRREARAWCKRYWEAAGFTVIEGSGHCRAAMCNDAAHKALELGADVLLFADADTWGTANQMHVAAAEAIATGQLVHAFDKYHKIDLSRTRKGLRGNPETASVRTYTRTVKPKTSHVSGLSAVPLALWEQLGGFDERFVGWGFEDQAFHLAAEVFGNGSGRVPGSAIHWYHKVDPSRGQTLPSPEDPRVQLIEQYCRAAGRIPSHGRVRKLGTSGFISVTDEQPNAKRMQEILSDPGGPLSSPGMVL